MKQHNIQGGGKPPYNLYVYFSILFDNQIKDRGMKNVKGKRNSPTNY